MASHCRRSMGWCAAFAGCVLHANANAHAPADTHAHTHTESTGRFDKRQAPTGASVFVNTSAPIKALSALPSLQVVSHHLLMRESPVSSVSFSALTHLGATHVRYVPWLPYQRVGVAELDPPSPPEYVCGPMAWVGGQTQPVALSCNDGDGGNATISSVEFASYGTPGGTCGQYTVDLTCHDWNSSAVVAALCVGRPNCTIDMAAFGAPPCPGAYLGVQVACEGATAVHTHWDFTYADSMMLDFWDAVDGDVTQPIPNFSTAPTWMYNSADWRYADNASQPWYGYESGTAPAQNLTMLGDYYGRLLAWYTRGGFIDEAGRAHISGHALNITLYEVFNEVDYEHGHTPETYVAEFDAIVAGIRRWADPDRRIKFIGLSLPNIDNETTVVQWARYFLNVSNHDPVARDALDFIGYHAYPTNGGYTPDPDTFTGMFAYVDEFVEKVLAVDAVIAALSPNTRTALDESGTDMDNVLAPGAPPTDNPLYWVASGSYFAYLFSRVSLSSNTVFVVGQSQLMDAPGQEPSVSILDWTTGNGTAKYWALKLLLDTYALGDVYIQTTVDGPAVHAQASLPAGSRTGIDVLLVNKNNSVVAVNVSAGAGPIAACTASIVDESTRNGPPRQQTCDGGALELPPYAVAVVNLGSG